MAGFPGAAAAPWGGGGDRYEYGEQQQQQQPGVSGAYLPPPGYDLAPTAPYELDPSEGLLPHGPGRGGGGGGGGGGELRPEYFAGMEEMLVYFEGVTAAVVNYSPADAAAIRNELQMLGARVLDSYTPACTHLLTPYQKGRDYDAARRDGKIVVSYAWLEDCLAARQIGRAHV